MFYDVTYNCTKHGYSGPVSCPQCTDMNFTTTTFIDVDEVKKEVYKEVLKWLKDQPLYNEQNKAYKSILIKDFKKQFLGKKKK